MLLPRKEREVENIVKSRPYLRISHPAAWFRLVMMLAVIVSGFAFMTIRSRGAVVTGIIGGTVFQDYNGNGRPDPALLIPNNGDGSVGAAIDPGFGGVTVTAYTSTNAVAGTAVTNGLGQYQINTAGSTGPYRVEFTNLPAGYYSSRFEVTYSRTTVQFVPEGGTSGANLGLVHPADFSQNNPGLAVPRYVKGPQDTSQPSIVGFPYSAGSASTDPNTPTSNFDQPGLTPIAASNLVGATWGLAWQRDQKRLYAGAFMKRYSGFGPSGTGGIYQINPATQGVVNFADLNALFPGSTGVSTHNFADPYDGGNTTWNAVGKVGLGGLAVSDDGTKLYVMALGNKTLYELPTGATPTVVNVRSSAAPTNPPGCANALDVRPFAVSYYRGVIYVGITCTAESTTAGGTVQGDSSQLRAYVYSVDAASLAFSAAPVFQFALNYPRRCADSAQVFPLCNSGLWLPWSPVFRNIGQTNNPPNIKRLVYPQPWLTSIEFDRGNMVLGLRDRVGDQSGLRSPDNPAEAPNVFYFGVAAGDILRACGSPGSGWTLEANARCGGLGIGPQNNGEGPGNAEYYFRDDSPIFNDETATGGQVQVPGFPDVVAGVIHPVPYVPNQNDDTFFDGGIRWFVNGTGFFSKSFRIINDELPTAEFFGKANGLGDIAALVDQPQSEIGNFVWYDVNKNGIQDPNESPIAGVTVQLYQGVTLLGSTVTNAAGQYYFNASNVAGGIQAGIAYEIRIGLADAALGGKLLTIANAGTDLHDSDGIAVGGNAVVTASIPILGANDHTFDFGFTDPVFDADIHIQIRKEVAQNCVEPGDRVVFRVTVTNLGPAVATGVVVSDDLPFGLLLDSITPSQGTCNNLDPATCNLGSLGVQQSATITIIMTIPANPPVNRFTNRATVTANEPDPNPSNNTAQATACLIVPGDPNLAPGPGEPFTPGALNDQKAGSVLFYNYYTSNASTPTVQNTRINMTNTSISQFVFVHLFFVDGQSCGISDKYVCLTANQTLTFLMSDLDPGVSGYLFAYAVDDVIGCPIQFNHLIGDALVKTFEGYSANLLAEAFWKLPGEQTGEFCNASSTTAVLTFDGAPGNYERAPRVLAASSVMDFSSGNRQLLILNRFGGNFFSGAFFLPPIFGILYDNQEVPASFSIPENGCQLVREMSDNFPTTSPRFETHIGPGETGWLKFFAAPPSEAGLMGAIINRNPNVASSAGAFNQGRNLHKLTFAASETITVPVFPPN